MRGSLVFIRRKNASWEFSEGGRYWREIESSGGLQASDALEVVRRLFPRATIAIMSSDFTGGWSARAQPA